MSGSASACFHCGAPIPAGVLVQESRPDGALSFCCRGCHGAYLMISGAGLEEFYRRRDWREPGLPADSFESSFSDSYLSRFVRPGERGSGIDLLVEGLRCASCVWLVEKILGRLPGVLEARLNYATGRAHVTFDPGLAAPSALFAQVAALGYRARPYTVSAAQDAARREQRDLLIRFGTAFFLTMQLMAYSFGLYAGYFQGIGEQMKQYLQLFSLLVTTPVVFYCGWPFLAGAWRSLVNRSPSMELLIATGALSSYGYSVFATLTGAEVYFETAAMIVTLILAGRLLENAAKRRSAGGIEALLGLTCGEAQRFAGEALETVEASELVAGDLILVAPGGRFPTDGRVVEGKSDVDQSPATGEPLPVLKQPGDEVIAGSTNLTGALRVTCERVAAESFIARVARLVEEAQSRRAPIQQVADRVSAYFVPAVLLLALATFCWRYGTGAALAPALMTALAVVVIACPCALGLATPTAILAGTGAAAGRGIIFKGGDILERLSRITLAAFDKTGTLSCGTPELTASHPAPGVDPAELLALAAAVESGSRHPLGRAIADRATAQGLPFAVGDELRTIPGAGVTGRVGASRVAVGSARFLEEQGIPDLPLPAGLAPGEVAVHVARDGRYTGTLVLRDRMRAEAKSLIDYFTGCRVDTLLLSGDRAESARSAARSLGISQGCGELSPADKAGRLEGLRREGAVVLMLGDGINDAPALSAADIGCAMAGGTDIAVETSDLVLARPDLTLLAEAHRVARRTMAVVRQNLAWAFVYNIVGIPLAMTGRLTPVYAAAAMALSSLCVVCNSLRLAGFKRG